MTDSAGAIAETMDYFPFGEIRLDNKVGTLNEQRKYIGQEYDADTGLNYLNARYYNSAIGRFISEDPLIIIAPEKFLSDPQQLNSYSYSRNNPITVSDPTGLSIQTGAQGFLSQIKSTLQGLITQLSKASPIDQAFQTAEMGVNILSDPVGTWDKASTSVKNFVSDTRNALKTAGHSDSGDYILGQRAGMLLPFVFGSLGAEEDAAAMEAEFPAEALVVRGGGLANQTAEKIDEAIALSATKGESGFSVQCSGKCTSIDQLGTLGQYLKNSKVAVTTVGEIRDAGGKVIKTPGIGEHATVFDLQGEAASPLLQNIYNNPNPLK